MFSCVVLFGKKIMSYPSTPTMSHSSSSSILKNNPAYGYKKDKVSPIINIPVSSRHNRSFVVNTRDVHSIMKNYDDKFPIYASYDKNIITGFRYKFNLVYDSKTSTSYEAMDTTTSSSFHFGGTHADSVPHHNEDTRENMFTNFVNAIDKHRLILEALSAHWIVTNFVDMYGVSGKSIYPFCHKCNKSPGQAEHDVLYFPIRRFVLREYFQQQDHYNHHQQQQHHHRHDHDIMSCKFLSYLDDRHSSLFLETPLGKRTYRTIENLIMFKHCGVDAMKRGLCIDCLRSSFLVDTQLSSNDLSCRSVSCGMDHCLYEYVPGPHLSGFLCPFIWLVDRSSRESMAGYCLDTLNSLGFSLAYQNSIRLEHPDMKTIGSFAQPNIDVMKEFEMLVSDMRPSDVRFKNVLSCLLYMYGITYWEGPVVTSHLCPLPSNSFNTHSSSGKTESIPTAPELRHMDFMDTLDRSPWENKFDLNSLTPSIIADLVQMMKNLHNHVNTSLENQQKIVMFQMKQIQNEFQRQSDHSSQLHQRLDELITNFCSNEASIARMMDHMNVAVSSVISSSSTTSATISQTLTSFRSLNEVVQMNEGVLRDIVTFLASPAMLKKMEYEKAGHQYVTQPGPKPKHFLNQQARTKAKNVAESAVSSGSKKSTDPVKMPKKRGRPAVNNLQRDDNFNYSRHMDYASDELSKKRAIPSDTTLQRDGDVEEEEEDSLFYMDYDKDEMSKKRGRPVQRGDTLQEDNDDESIEDGLDLDLDD